ncbi:MAG TPA: ornithine cyclodeaminase family protein [Paenalcaligenes hominis]|uniref:Ornithine cyclodeaminase family protein n=1 Tax=Paenalcaligenes hominis TaxID=643674 RepID=A0A9D2VE90_9BURK|nr:ornithine cyclodeaminase family protein [Paenalcaligenes hominis]
MKIINNAAVRKHVVPLQLERVLEQAYLSWAHGQVAMQPRFRTEVGDFRLVSMGAVLKELGYAGSKIYTSYQGKLCFKIMLFDAANGDALALLDSDELTPLRTAASSVLVARRYADPEAERLGVYGLGPLGLEHIKQFIQAFPIRQLYVCDPKVSVSKLKAVLAAQGIGVHQVESKLLARSSQIIVTATRSTTPVFESLWVQNGTFVAAIGSCLAHAQELDPCLVDRAKKVVVEWPEQTLKDTGDLYLYKDKEFLLSKIEAMAHTLQNDKAAHDPKSIVIYKAVGVALADIAAAGLAYEQYQSQFSY